MSWFSDLTGKAGALLDKMDQAAANSLQEAGIAAPSPAKTTTGSKHITAPRTLSGVDTGAPYEPTAYQSLNSPSERGAAVAQVLVGSASGSAQLTSTPKQSKQPPITYGMSQSKESVTDDSIFKFLNTPSLSDGSSGKKASGHRVKHTPTSSRPNSARSTRSIEESNSQSILPPVVARPQEVGSEGTKKVEKDPPLDRDGGREEEVEVDKAMTEEVENADEADGGPIDSTHPPTDEGTASPDDRPNTPGAGEGVASTGDGSHEAELEEWKHKVSTLELENKLMKREVSALNEELSGVMSRINEASSVKAHYESEMHALREQASRSDHMIRQLRSHEEDLRATALARDSQVEVLRTQLSGADRALLEAKEKLVSSKREQERLVQDANLSSGAQNQALDSLKNQLSQALSQLEREQEDHEAEKLRFVERESFLQSERVQVTDRLASLQKQVAAEQRKTGELQAALQATQRESQALRKEHEDYKQRATGILQAKEKLLGTLQHSGGESGTAASDVRLEEARLEKEHLQAQLTNALQQLERARKNLQDLEEKSSIDMDGAMEQIKVCEGVLSEEKKQHTATRDELDRLNHELEMVREDLGKERTRHREDVEAKEAEIVNLNLRMAVLNPGREELEARLHELTDSLIEKQTALETMHSEKTTINLQIQRLQGELAQAQRHVPVSPHTTIQVNGPESSSQANTGSQVPSMSSMIPSLEHATFDSRLHKVRRAVNTVDRISIRLGAFLKRYPQARLFTLVYMLLLHVWVMVVMLTYSPEIHNENTIHPGI